MVDEKWKEIGFIDEPIPFGVDIKEEVRKMCEEKNAVVLAHYYTNGEIQDLADFVGDSLALAQKAAKTDADIIVMCGVHFMGETNKILCPDKKILVPDLNATCSLAQSCLPEEFKGFLKKNPNHIVVSYVNTSAAIKALTDVVVTSSNAKQIVESLPKDAEIIFGPDRNLGEYINKQTGRHMLLWNGACHVHDKFSPEAILRLKKKHPNAKVLVHPECRDSVVRLGDKVGSTSALLNFCVESEATEFIVVTESGILHKMKQVAPNKMFIPVPPADGECGCNECNYMKLITLKKIYNCLKYEWPAVEVDSELSKMAVKPINKMLEISKNLGF